MNEYANFTELGTYFGMTRNFVGKRLKELGLRTPEGKPSQKAFVEGFVAQRWAQDRPGIYLWAWERDKTIAVLEQSGLRRAVPVDHAEFTARRSGTTGCEILNHDGEIVAWTVDELWAAKIVAALNRGE
jgi:hypothetical protein